jgi:hypothetical protein
MLLDCGLQVKFSGSKQSLRIETPEARKAKSILLLVWRDTCHLIIETKDHTWIKERR